MGARPHNVHCETRIAPFAHAVARGVREYWCQAPRCGFTTSELVRAAGHVASRQYDATSLPPVEWPEVVASTAIIRGNTPESVPLRRDAATSTERQ